MDEFTPQNRQEQVEILPVRRPNGQFAPGRSGNPGGRPKSLAAFQDAAREHTALAISVLVQIASDEAAPATARLVASAMIMDRAFGKTPEALAVHDFRRSLEQDEKFDRMLAEIHARQAAADGEEEPAG